MYTSASPEFRLRSFLSSGSSSWVPQVHESSGLAPSFDDVTCRAYLNDPNHGSDDGYALNVWLGGEAGLSAGQNHTGTL